MGVTRKEFYSFERTEKVLEEEEKEEKEEDSGRRNGCKQNHAPFILYHLRAAWSVNPRISPGVSNPHKKKKNLHDS